MGRLRQSQRKIYGLEKQWIKRGAESTQPPGEVETSKKKKETESIYLELGEVILINAFLVDSINWKT